MKMAFIAPLRRLLAALAPGNLRDALNKHSRMVNSIALLVILLVIADVAGWFGAAKQWLTFQGQSSRRSGSRPPQHNVYVRALHCPAQFITAMVSDGHGGAWVGSEDSGIYHYQPGAAVHWKRFDKANSPGLISNHIYSLCLDAKGRLWAGTLRHGVCVFNGVQWKHYGLLNGPLGCHVVAITSNPYDKSVWMCTEAGISIYEIGKHKWRYLPQATPEKSDDTRANGLPPNPDCVAFNTHGVAFVGTQCNGLAIGYPPYHSWWMVKGPWKMPRTPFGKGLPSNLVNAVVAGRHGRIYVATDEGLAWDSPDNPYTFQYERGADYAAKVKGLWHPPARFKMPPRAFLNHLLPADHITCLAVDQNGKLWLGTWHSGLWTNDTRGPGAPAQGDIKEMTRAIVRFNTVWRARRAILARWAKKHKTTAVGGAVDRRPSSGALPPLPPHTRFQVERLDVSAILPLANGAMLIGHHCVGVSEARLSPPPSGWERVVNAVHHGIGYLTPWLSGPERANLPTPAKAPTSAQLAALYRNLLKNHVSQKTVPIVIGIPITDDWRTQGSWLGRYGRYWACLFACIPPPGVGDYVWAPGPLALDHTEGIGPHHRLIDNGPYHLPEGDAVRYWVQWRMTASSGALELPEVYLGQCVTAGAATWKLDRRQSEIDDHGETYPPTWQGPDLYVYLHIPPGAYTLSLYFKERHIRGLFNRYYHMGRDQVISLIPLPASYDFGTALNPNTAPLAKMRGEAQSRVVDFDGGVWKRFLIRGPMKLAIRIMRNYSINSMISGAMLDPLSEHPAPYYFGHRAWQACEKQRREFRTRFVARWRSGQLSADPSDGRTLWHRHPSYGPGLPTGRANTSGLAMAWRILQILSLLEHRNPAAWATNQRLAYLSVLRWGVASRQFIPVPTYREDAGSAIPKSSAAAAAEKCYYHLCLFHHWEAVEKSRSLLTSREIEKGLRWDGGATNYRGLEFTVIRRSLAAQGTAIGAAVPAVTPSRSAQKYSLPEDGEGVPLADRLVRILGVPNRGGSYLSPLARVCDYLSHAVRPGVRRPIRTALAKAVPLVAEIVAAINHGAAPTLLREKILGTITLSGYSIPLAGRDWQYGNLRERRAIAAFMAWHGVQLLRSGNRTAAAQWEIASVMLSAQDDMALGTVGVLGRYLPATPGSPMYEPSALTQDIFRQLRGMCERRLSADTRFYFEVYGIETLARNQLDRKGPVPLGVRDAYLNRLKVMIGKAVRGSLSRQYFFLRRLIAVQRVWGMGDHYRMATDTMHALTGWRRALLSTAKTPLANRDALLRWIQEASLLEPGSNSAPKEEGMFDWKRVYREYFHFPARCGKM
ncbi:MAG: ligand-binding sensor domain-containing protein [Phycisphaerae bacterium]